MRLNLCVCRSHLWLTRSLANGELARVNSRAQTVEWCCRDWERYEAIRLVACHSGGPYAIANQPFQQSKHWFKYVAIILGVYSIYSCQQEGELLLIVAYLVSQSMVVDSITRGKAKPLPCQVAQR